MPPTPIPLIWRAHSDPADENTVELFPADPNPTDTESAYRVRADADETQGRAVHVVGADSNETHGDTPDDISTDTDSSDHDPVEAAPAQPDSANGDSRRPLLGGHADEPTLTPAIRSAESADEREVEPVHVADIRSHERERETVDRPIGTLTGLPEVMLTPLIRSMPSSTKLNRSPVNFFEFPKLTPTSLIREIQRPRARRRSGEDERCGDEEAARERDKKRAPPSWSTLLNLRSE